MKPWAFLVLIFSLIQNSNFMFKILWFGSTLSARDSSGKPPEAPLGINFARLLMRELVADSPVATAPRVAMTPIFSYTCFIFNAA